MLSTSKRLYGKYRVATVGCTGKLVLSAYKRLQGKSRVAAVGCIGSWCRLLTRGCRGKLYGYVVQDAGTVC